jgi:hypothetical protein
VRRGRKAKTFIETVAISETTRVTSATIAVIFVRMSVDAGRMFGTCGLTKKAMRPNRNCAKIAERSPATRATSGVTGGT